MAESEGRFLELALLVRAFAHLTTPHRVSSVKLNQLFLAWIGRIQARHEMTLGWVRSIERSPKAHIHAAIFAAAPLDCDSAASLWQEMIAPRYSEAAIVEPYRRGLCGLGYILKQLDSPAEDIQYSDNIVAFGPGNGKSRFRTSSAQRRQIRRIKAEIRRAAPKPMPMSEAAPEGDCGV